MIILGLSAVLVVILMVSLSVQSKSTAADPVPMIVDSVAIQPKSPILSNTNSQFNEPNDCQVIAQSESDSLNRGFQVSPTTFFVVSTNYSTLNGLCYFVLHNQIAQNTSQFGKVTSDIYDLYSQLITNDGSYVPSTALASCDISDSQSGMSDTTCSDYMNIQTGANISYSDYQSLVQKYMHMH